jgi:hypothetical protein
MWTEDGFYIPAKCKEEGGGGKETVSRNEFTEVHFMCRYENNTLKTVKKGGSWKGSGQERRSKFDQRTLYA